MKKQTLYLIPVFVLLAFVLSACSHSTVTTGDDEDEPEVPPWTQTDDDIDTTDDTTDTNTDTDTTTDDETTDPGTDSGEGDLLATISGKSCYPTSPIPPELRVYLKDNKTGKYVYKALRGARTWTFDEVVPGTYKIYLSSGVADDGIKEGRYTKASVCKVKGGGTCTDHDWEILEVKSGASIVDIEPCDFDF